MRKVALLLVVILAAGRVLAEPMQLAVVKRADNGKGMLCKLQDRKIVLFVEGTPAEMGTAHGQLLANEIKGMHERVLVVAAGYVVSRDDWFFTRIEEVIRRTSPHTPPRFIEECDAMSHAVGIPIADGRQMNFFPEMFHCSGVAVRDTATADGRVIHARVLDYMRDIGIQNFSAVMVFMPQGHNAWISESFAGFMGTVTAMNEKGLAMGEMGGRGEGKWDGLPMSFMMRRVMEECGTVDEAIKLMQSIPLTCDYYYILSDKGKNMAAVGAITGTPIAILKPGEKHEMLPLAIQDTVYVSAGERARHLSERLTQNFGKITPQSMMEIIKRPVAMSSNLHNAIFLPETGTMYFADAGAKTVACDETYYRVNLPELLEYYRATGKQTEPAK